MTTRGAAAVLAALAIVTAACSGDDDASSSTTTSADVPGSTSAPETTAPPTSAPPPTVATSPPTTSPPATTESVDQLNAEIEAAYRDLDAKGYALLQHPSLDGLDTHIAEIAVPGSPYAQAIATRVTQLVNDGQYLMPNNPNLDSLTIEAINFTGAGMADVTACQVSNAVTINMPDRSPIPGHSLPVAGTGGVFATRVTESMVLTPSGWRHDGVGAPNDPIWKGLDQCPPA